MSESLPAPAVRRNPHSYVEAAEEPMLLCPLGNLEACLVKLLDGVEASKSLRAQVAKGVLEMQQKHGVTPGLAAVLVGDDPASAVYIRNKERACAEVGILSEVFRLEQDASEGQLLETVASLNADPKYHGILVQLPLPDARRPVTGH